MRPMTACFYYLSFKPLFPITSWMCQAGCVNKFYGKILLMLLIGRIRRCSCCTIYTSLGGGVNTSLGRHTNLHLIKLAISTWYDYPWHWRRERVSVHIADTAWRLLHSIFRMQDEDFCQLSWEALSTYQYNLWRCRAARGRRGPSNQPSSKHKAPREDRHQTICSVHSPAPLRTLHFPQPVPHLFLPIARLKALEGWRSLPTKQLRLLEAWICIRLRYWLAELNQAMLLIFCWGHLQRPRTLVVWSWPYWPRILKNL